MYALIDCNNFYASCERVFQPIYNNQPVVILSNNDGCIISRSNEAKELGIKMGAPEFQCKELIKQHNIKVFSSNYALYGDLSERVMNIMKMYCATVEVYSIDEAFLNFKGTKIDNYTTYGIKIKNHVQKCLSLPISIGFAPSKALSKVANKIAKKYPKQTNGCYVIDSEEKKIKALKWTKIEDIWGIGFRLSKKMKAKNILTAYDFILQHNSSFIKKEMGVVGTRLIMELRGESVISIEEPKNKKTIAITRSFEKNITEFNDLKERISTFATVCSEKLRKQKSCCYSIIIFIRKDKYKEQEQPYSFYKSKTLPFPTNTAFTISQTAIEMLKEIYTENQNYKKAGVIVTQLIPEDQKQFNLFDEENPKLLKLTNVIDLINSKNGKRIIKLGNQDMEKTWKMKQNHLSNKYTTNIKEILKVKC